MSQPNSQQITYATGWFVSGGSPDYWNACSNGMYNTMGYQQDCCGGHAYAGEYEIASINTPGDDIGREYIGTKLTDTLEAGHKYLANMYVNRSNEWNYSIATMGILFTDTAIILPNPQKGALIQANPQIKNEIPLTDTANWVLVQDTFMAVGNETYLTIGNFNNTATSDTLMSPGGFGTWGAFGSAYYYIDGVSVYDVTGGTCNTYWDAGYDKYVLAGDSIRLGAINTDNSIYSWQNSAGGGTYLSSNVDARPWCKPTQTTIYYVTKTCPNNNVFKDTVTVYVQQPNGIKQFTDNVAIKLFPNPNNGTMSLTYNLHTDAVMQISDLTGNLVGSYYMPSTNTNIPVQNNYLQNGVYLYRVICNDVIIKLGKIVVMQ